MITKYRNRGIVLFILAAAMSVLFVVTLRKSAGLLADDRWRDYLLSTYLGAAILWTMTSYTLARAKGYQSEALARVLMLSLFIGFCCQPAALIFPFLGFVLKDQTQSRRRRRRRDS